MRILAFDTTGRTASVSYRNGKGEISSLHSDEGYNHLTSLMPMIQELVGDGAIDVIAVSAGPGSFTGIRIGVSTARALMQGLKIPAISVKTLETFAHAAYASDAKAVPENSDFKIRIVCPIFDARREAIYGAGYLIGKSAGEFADILPERQDLPGIPGFCAIAECAEPLTVFLAKLRDLTDALFLQEQKSKKDIEISVEFYGDGVDKYRDKIDQFFAFLLNREQKISVEYADAKVRYQRAEWVMRSAIAQMSCKESGVRTLINNPEELLPNYLRKAEAERNLEKKKTNGN